MKKVETKQRGIFCSKLTLCLYLEFKVLGGHIEEVLFAYVFILTFL